MTNLMNKIKIDMLKEHPFEIKFTMQIGSDTRPFIDVISHLKNRGLTNEDYKFGFMTTQVIRGQTCVSRASVFLKDENEALLFKLRFS